MSYQSASDAAPAGVALKPARPARRVLRAVSPEPIPEPERSPTPKRPARAAASRPRPASPSAAPQSRAPRAEVRAVPEDDAPKRRASRSPKARKDDWADGDVSAPAACMIGDAEVRREKTPVNPTLVLAQSSKMSFGDWLASLPVPTSAAKPSNPSVWLSEFSNYLFALLAPMYPDPDARAKMCSEPIIRIFRRAFTDISFSSDDNEAIEMLGDRMLYTTFSRHLKARIPNITSRVLTNYSTNYLSKDGLAATATRLQMHRWVLLGAESQQQRDGVATLSLREDTFEAFIAALDQAANALHQQFIREQKFKEAVMVAVHGTEAVRMFIDFYFDGTGIDPKMSEDSAKSTLLDIGTVFGIRNRAIIFDSPPEGTANPKHSVRVHPVLIEVLRENGIPNFPSVLAENFPNKTDAAKAALEQAALFGVTREWISEKREMSRSIYRLSEDLQKAVLDKAKAQGFTKVVSEIPDRTRQVDGSYTLVLIGSDAANNRRTLADAVGYSLVPTLELAARNYLAS